MIRNVQMLGLIIFLTAITNLSIAQNSTLSSGGDAISSKGSVSYSVGQIVYTKIIGGNASIAQGVQQPYEISDITEIYEVDAIKLSCSVFPNPSSNELSLEIEGNLFKKMAYQLFDMSGKLFISNAIVDHISTFQVANLSAGIYLLKVSIDENLVKTFKIIKN